MRRPRAIVQPLMVALLLAWVGTAWAADRASRVLHISGLPVVKVSAGKWTPLYRSSRGDETARVASFWLMQRPVQNGEFLAFVDAHPEYRRGKIASVFADARYLAHWQGPLSLGPDVRAEQPVTHVSWFAASAFCEAHGMRLPSEAEWELAAAASAKRKNASADPAFRKAILDWYAMPRGELPDVPHGPPNLYGARDLHQVIWEWVMDFNNSVVVADSRERGETMGDAFCGGASLAASDSLDYPAFMRVAMRSSLEAPYTGVLLGFRCAADASVKAERKP